MSVTTCPVALLAEYLAARDGGGRMPRELLAPVAQSEARRLLGVSPWEITGITPHGDVYPSDSDGRRYTFTALGWRVFGCAPWSDTGKRWLTVERVASAEGV